MLAGDVLEHDFQLEHAVFQRLHDAFDENSFTVENTNGRVDYFAMHEKRHSKRRNRGLHQRLALPAYPLAADMAFHSKCAGLLVELLGDILADTLQLAAATAAGAVRFVPYFLAWQR